MENTNQPNLPQEPNAAIPAIEARLSLLERQTAERSAAFEALAAEDRPTKWAELSAELAHHRDQLRDYEKALVDRIADVDDDRRATASRLQRAWQTQREEIDERLRRHTGLFGGLLMLVAVLFGVALFLVYRQASMGQPLQIAAEISKMQQQPVQAPASVAVVEQVRAELNGLTAKVGEIAAALERLDQGSKPAEQKHIAAERAAREQAEVGIAADIGRLDAEHRRVSQELGTLRAALETLETREAARADGPAVVVAPVLARDEVQSAPAEDAGLEDAEDEQPVLQTPLQPADEGAAETQRDAGPADEESGADVSGTEETLIAGGDIYALQLIGFFNRKSLDEFLDREGLPARVYSVRQIYQGRPWYALIHSLHDDYAAAEEELSRLPPDLLALDPWIRPLSEVTELQIIETRQPSE